MAALQSLAHMLFIFSPWTANSLLVQENDTIMIPDLEVVGMRLPGKSKILTPDLKVVGQRFRRSIEGNSRTYDVCVKNLQEGEENPSDTAEAQPGSGAASEKKQAAEWQMPKFAQDSKGITKEKMIDIDNLEKLTPTQVIKSIKKFELGGDSRSATDRQIDTLKDLEPWDKKKLTEFDTNKENAAVHIPLPLWPFDEETQHAFNKASALKSERVAYLPIFVPKAHKKCADGKPPRAEEDWWKKVYLPGNLGMFRSIIEKAFAIEKATNPGFEEEYYAYLTLDHGDVKAFSTQRVPGWHVDGFQGDERTVPGKVERNYFASNRLPTLYANDYHFHLDHLDNTYNHFSAMDSEIHYLHTKVVACNKAGKTCQECRQELASDFDDLKDVPGFPCKVIREGAANVLSYMDGYTPHSPNFANHNIERAFFRLQFAVAKYDRVGPADNPLLCNGEPLFKRIQKPWPNLKQASEHPDAKNHPYHQFAKGDWYNSFTHGGALTQALASTGLS